MKNLNKNQPLRKLPQFIGFFIKIFLLKGGSPPCILMSQKECWKKLSNILFGSLPFRVIWEGLFNRLKAVGDNRLKEKESWGGFYIPYSLSSFPQFIPSPSQGEGEGGVF